MKINSKVIAFIPAMQINLKLVSCVPCTSLGTFNGAKCPLRADISLSECNTD